MITEQILLEGETKQFQVNSTMKWWSKCISMVIAKTVSRSVAFKAGKTSEIVFDTRANFVTPEVRGHDVSSGHESLVDDDVESIAQTYTFLTI